MSEKVCSKCKGTKWKKKTIIQKDYIPGYYNFTKETKVLAEVCVKCGRITQARKKGTK